MRKALGRAKRDKDVHVSLSVLIDVSLHADDGCLFDALGFSVVARVLRLLIGAPAKLSKACDHQMTDLLEVGIAGDKEHVTCDTLLEHLLASDVVGA